MYFTKNYSVQLRTVTLLLALWVTVTAFNITKAVHIDDTAYLETAQNILINPLHPLSGKVNWGNSADPAFHMNQPVLLSYLYALCMFFAGRSEIVLHCSMACFSGFAILMFFKLAKLFTKTPFILTALFFLGPAFIPSQNLMTDVPMAALWIAFFWLLMHAPSPSKQIVSQCLAGVIVALACLIKYTSLVLLVILLLELIKIRQWKMLWILLIPLTVLGAWSSFNIFDYGHIHVFTRTTNVTDPLRVLKRLGDWIFGLGSITPFAFLCAPFLYKRSSGARILLGTCAGAGIPAFLGEHYILHQSVGLSLLATYFYVNGLLLLFTIMWSFANKMYSGKKQPFSRLIENWHYALLMAWLLGSALFNVLFAHFVAIRHILISLPAVIMLFGMMVVPHLVRRSVWIGVCLTSLMGIWVAVSDWEYADCYRSYSKKISQELGNDKTIWQTGHWGWQWYALHEGMRQYDAETTHLRAGDFVVVPRMVSAQNIAGDQKDLLEKYDEIIVPASWTMYLRTMVNLRGYYAFSILSFPWAFSTDPVDVFTIYKVIKN